MSEPIHRPRRAPESAPIRAVLRSPSRPRLTGVAVAAAIAAGITAAPAPAAAALPTYEPGEVIVKFKPGADAAARAAVRQLAGSVGRDPIASDIEVLELPAGSSVAATVAKLSAGGDVAVAQPNHVYRLSATPNDPQYAQQWFLNNAANTDIDAPQSWDVSDASGATVTTAVIDTGVQLNHPDLQSMLWTNPGETGTDSAGQNKRTNGQDDDDNGKVDDWRGWDFASSAAGDNDPSPLLVSGQPDPHGTHVAGIVAAQRNNAVGVAGVSKHARIMPILAFSADAQGQVSSNDTLILEAIRYAKRNGAKVVNGSFGQTAASSTLIQQEISSATDVTFVFAAGNDGQYLDGGTAVSYPCMVPSPNVICVGASDPSNKRTSISNHGAVNVDLSAPGQDIRSTLPGSTYGDLSGTSMATPVVAGAVATLRAYAPTLTPSQIRDRLMSNAVAFGTVNASGSGRVNLDRAVRNVSPPVTATATVAVSSGRVTYTAAAGGRNALTITGSGTTYTLDDSRTNLTPGAGCTAVNARRVTCTGVGAITTNLGDLDDVLSAVVPVPVTVNAGSGGSTIVTGSGADQITGGELADTVTSGAGNDTVTTGGGDDDVRLGDGNDTAYLGDGNDVVNAGGQNAGNDTLWGGAGDDVLMDGVGSDTINGEAGNDTTASGSDSAIDTVNGGAGDDLLYTRPGAEVLLGGDGNDTVDYSLYTVPVRIQLGDGTGANGATGETDRIGVDVENATGGSANDVLLGDAGPNRLAGGFGADYVSGAGGDDTLDEASDGVSYPSPGNDDLYGGPGFDKVSYARPANLGAITATLDGLPNDGAVGRGEADNIRTDVEWIVGSDADDRLTAGTYPAWLDGGKGKDTLIGGSANDVLLSRDGVADTKVDCGGGTGDVALHDALDAPLVSCETRTVG